MEKLFTYGTLQIPQIQKDLFGRIPEGDHDILRGYSESSITIIDPEMIEKTGTLQHPILSFTGKPSDQVYGIVFDVSYDDLMKADKYQEKHYQRVEADFHSGNKAWVYIAR